MILRELLAVVNSHITLVISGMKEEYKIKSDIPDARLNFEVKTIEAIESRLIIKLDEPRKVPTLEELGYSFETGV